MSAVPKIPVHSEPHVCHILRLVDAGPFANHPDFGADAALRKRPIGWGPTDDDHGAFVFPSQRMAVRFAHHLLYATGTRWMAVSTPGRIASIKPAHACRGCGCTQADACPSGCGWVEVDLCSECLKQDPPTLWSVYRGGEEPTRVYVARRSIGEVPLDETLTAPTLERLREMRPAGAMILKPGPDDEPDVIETWM